VRNRWFVFRLLSGGLLTVFVVLYPMLISIYVFLPLFVGFSGWMMIRGIEGAGYAYVVIPLIYLVNLEINLSLPLMMVVLATLLYYLTLYERVTILKRCRVCVAVLSVILIDAYYLGSLMIYDLLMDTSSIVIDKLLWYSLIADIVLAVL
jgi:hypothetical protein